MAHMFQLLATCSVPMASLDMGACSSGQQGTGFGRHSCTLIFQPWCCSIWGVVTFSTFFFSFLTCTCYQKVPTITLVCTQILPELLGSCGNPLLTATSHGQYFRVVSSEDLITFPSCWLTVSSEVLPSLTRIIPHLKHSRPLTDRRCSHSRYHLLQHLSNVFWNSQGGKMWHFQVFCWTGAMVLRRTKAAFLLCREGDGDLSCLSAWGAEGRNPCVLDLQAAGEAALFFLWSSWGTLTLLLLIKFQLGNKL